MNESFLLDFFYYSHYCMSEVCSCPCNLVQVQLLLFWDAFVPQFCTTTFCRTKVLKKPLLTLTNVAVKYFLLFFSSLKVFGTLSKCTAVNWVINVLMTPSLTRKPPETLEILNGGKRLPVTQYFLWYFWFSVLKPAFHWKHIPYHVPSCLFYLRLPSAYNS